MSGREALLVLHSLGALFAIASLTFLGVTTSLAVDIWGGFWGGPHFTRQCFEFLFVALGFSCVRHVLGFFLLPARKAADLDVPETKMDKAISGLSSLSPYITDLPMILLLAAALPGAVFSFMRSIDDNVPYKMWNSNMSTREVWTFSSMSTCFYVCFVTVILLMTVHVFVIAFQGSTNNTRIELTAEVPSQAAEDDAKESEKEQLLEV